MMMIVQKQQNHHHHHHHHHHRFSRYYLSSESIHKSDPEIANEDILLGRTDPIGRVVGKFNPWVIRIFKQFKEEPCSAKLILLRRSFDASEKVLIFLDKNSGKFGKLKHNASITNSSFLPTGYQEYRKLMGSRAPLILKDLTRGEDYQSLASFMTILLPTNESAWVLYDTLVNEAITSHSLLEKDINTGLITSYALYNAMLQLKFQTRKFKTPISVINHLLKLKYQNPGTNIFHHVSLRTMTDANTRNELFAPIASTGMNGSSVRASPRVEKLGVLLFILHRTEWKHLDPQYVLKWKALLQDITEYGVETLLSTHSPIKLNALQLIWQSAPGILLPNSSLFYKMFYEQVLYSLTLEPLQVSNEEMMMVTLLQSMHETKFKNSLLVSKLEEITLERGFDYQKAGISVFINLLELDAVPFALMVFENFLQSHHSTSLDFNRGKTLFSEKAKGHVYNVLLEKKHRQPYRCMDLIIAILCFNLSDRSSAQYKLLEYIEIDMLRLMREKSLSLYEAGGLLYAYGTETRYFPPIVKELNSVIDRDFDKATIMDILRMLWSTARLNDRSASYLPKVLNRLENDKRKISHGFEGTTNVCRLLWSLAVLEMLELQMVVHYLPILKQLLKTNDNGTYAYRHSINFQMTQIYAELIACGKKPNSSTTTNSSDDSSDTNGSDDTNKSSSSSSTRIAMGMTKYGYSDLDKMLPWKLFNKRITDTSSSFMHMTTSRLLNCMGIEHCNEWQLSNGYIVDIFIFPPKLKPASSLSSLSLSTTTSTISEATGLNDVSPLEVMTHRLSAIESDSNTEGTILDAKAHNSHFFSDHTSLGPERDLFLDGIVLEFDGPTHFESYRKVSEERRGEKTDFRIYEQLMFLSYLIYGYRIPLSLCYSVCIDIDCRLS